MFLPLHPSRSSFTLQYHTRSVSPISLRLCLSVSTSPLGSERPMYPHERERWESLKYWWPQARATSGTLCRGYRPGPQSHWVRVAELQWRGQVCHGRWKRGGGKQMRRSDGVCMCACKNHVIPAASWLRHMRPVVCFRVILSFVQGRACTEWVDSWAWLCPSSFLRDQPEHKHEVGFELSACLCTPPPSLPFFSVAFFHRSWHPPPPKHTHNQTLHFLPLLIFCLLVTLLIFVLKLSLSLVPPFFSGWLRLSGEGDLVKENHENRHGDGIWQGDAYSEEKGERGGGGPKKESRNEKAVVWRQLHHRAYFLLLLIHGPITLV